jgi:zinc transport system substrate-binding protein
LGHKVIAAVLIVVVAVVAIVYCYSGKSVTTKKIQVTASFYPLAEFARQVGGDKVSVTNITPAGAEPHDFEPSPKDIVKLHQSKVFIFSGSGFEPWSARVLPTLTGVVAVDAHTGIPLLQPVPGQPENFKVDPHYYLDPVNDEGIVQTIAKKLVEVDPANKEYYESNAAAYIKKLVAVDNAYRDGLRNTKRKDFVTSHAAFAYLAKRYGLVQIAIAGLSVDEEPSPARLAEITTIAKQNHIKYIFFEALVSPRLSETIASEVGAKTLVLDPLEGLTPAEQKAGKDYIKLMLDDLTNLRLALNS